MTVSIKQELVNFLLPACCLIKCLNGFLEISMNKSCVFSVCTQEEIRPVKGWPESVRSTSWGGGREALILEVDFFHFVVASCDDFSTFLQCKIAGF